MQIDHPIDPRNEHIFDKAGDRVGRTCPMRRSIDAVEIVPTAWRQAGARVTRHNIVLGQEKQSPIHAVRADLATKIRNDDLPLELIAMGSANHEHRGSLTTTNNN